MRTYQVLDSSMYPRNSAFSSIARSREKFMKTSALVMAPLRMGGTLHSCFFMTSSIHMTVQLAPRDAQTAWTQLDRGRIDMVGTTVGTVDVRPDEDFHARLDLGVVVHQLDQRIHRCLGDS